MRLAEIQKGMHFDDSDHWQKVQDADFDPRQMDMFDDDTDYREVAGDYPAWGTALIRISNIPKSIDTFPLRLLQRDRHPLHHAKEVRSAGRRPATAREENRTNA